MVFDLPSMMEVLDSKMDDKKIPIIDYLAMYQYWQERESIKDLALIYGLDDLEAPCYSTQT